MVTIKKKKDMEKDYVLNQKGLRIFKRCASCIHKDTSKSSNNDNRWCKAKQMTVLKSDCCERWMISNEMDNAG